MGLAPLTNGHMAGSSESCNPSAAMTPPLRFAAAGTLLSPWA